MSLRRLRGRVPSVRFVAVGVFRTHRLRSHKVSNDGSGKCDAEATGNLEDHVIGVVYDIADNERPDLDRKEGLGSGYDAREIEVTTDFGNPTALMYFAIRVDSALQPYLWYKEHVLIGASENELPSEYTAQIEAVEALDAPDTKRHERELAIYR